MLHACARNMINMANSGLLCTVQPYCGETSNRILYQDHLRKLIIPDAVANLPVSNQSVDLLKTGRN